MGISKLKELKSKLEIAEKQISQLSAKIIEKDKIISELKEEIQNLKIKKQKFDSLTIEEKIVEFEFKKLNTCDNIDENCRKENIVLKEKIKKMKAAINELSSKLEKDIIIKEKKNLKINENNSKLFEDLQKKNKELVKMLKQINLQNMALRKEKYDLETICIKQEDSIKTLNIKLNSNNSKKKLKQCLYSQTNIHIQKEALPKISNSSELGTNSQISIYNRSDFLPIVK